LAGFLFLMTAAHAWHAADCLFPEIPLSVAQVCVAGFWMQLGVTLYFSYLLIA